MKFPITNAGKKKRMAEAGLATLMQSHKGLIHSPHKIRNTSIKECPKSLKFHRGTGSGAKAVEVYKGPKTWLPSTAKV